MPHKFTLKNFRYESTLVRSRMIMAGVIMLLLGITIIARIFYLQIIKHEHFTTLSQHNRVKVLPIAPIRGLIFSSDNVLLADNRPTFSLELTPERIDNLDRLFRQLGEIITITDANIKRFKDQLKKKRRFESMPLRFNLSDEEVAKISVDLHQYPGVDVVARLNRYYPIGSNIAHTIGYVGMIDEDELKSLDTSNYSATKHIGKIGVEKAYEKLLHGVVGYQQVEVNAQGRVIRVLNRIPSQSGKNIYLALDVSLQNLAVEALAGKRGAIVAIDPGDGGILALVSSPGYDPNLFVNGIDHQSYNNLLNSNDVPLLNRALQGKYPPGSTIKPFIALAALNLGIRSTDEETWCPGWFSLRGSSHRYRDWKKQGHGHVDLLNAIAQSCDVYFYSLANDLGINRLQQALKLFGFGEKTGVDIGGEGTGLVPTPEWKLKSSGQSWYRGETVIVGIGQGFMSVTPIQLAKATATLANRGRIVQPHLLAETHDISTNEIVKYVPSIDMQEIALIDTAHWDEMTNAMTEAIHGIKGTARRTGLNAKYRFAGKTGTAQVIGIPQDEEIKDEDLPEKFQDHALFIAFAPVEEPKIAIAIIIENGGSGSRGAAPIARRLFDHYLVNKKQRKG